MRTNGKLVALVGPNEAGKSSLLQAIAQLADDSAPELSDVSRGSDSSEFLIEGHFFLSPSEVESVGLDGSRWLIIRKGIDGERSYEIRPAPPKRDLSPRGKLYQAISFAVRNKKFRDRLDDEQLEELDDTWEDVSEILKAETEDLDETDFSRVRDLLEIIGSNLDSKDAATIRKTPEIHKLWELEERIDNPANLAIEKAVELVPEIVEFSEEDRDLRSEYSFSDLAEEIPIAFQNLCEIGQLDTGELISAYKQGDTARLTTIEHAANRNLESAFGENWKQSGISVTIRIHGESVVVQVVNERSEFTSLAERSDGLRQFVALQAFSTSNWGKAPILLIDEAEQKLHYDAQADLVQMLARQKVASKVIFTTHSAGCLPEDLGNGVRFARPSLQDETRSEIVNKFWSDNEPGFAPILFGMGASTLAFFPTRRAVMVEGPADMLLLPTMFREALNSDVVGFQFVPGLSVSEGLFHPPVLGKKAGITYLVDGDAGGDKIKKKLGGLGIDAKNIFVLKALNGSAVETEDFIDPRLLVEGVNRLIAKFHGAVEPIKKNGIPAKKRMAQLEIRYKKATGSPLSKVDLAYEVLDILAADPFQSIFDPKRKSSFSNLAQAVLARFKEMKQ